MSQEDTEPVTQVDTSQSDTSGDAPRDTTSDQKVESTPTVDPDDPDGVLARLTEVKQKKTKDESESVDAEASADEDTSSDSESEEQEKPEEKSKDVEPDLDSEDGQKSVLSDIQNERTRKRVEKLLTDRKEAAPLADYGAQIISKAAKVGAKKSDMDAWIDLGVGFLAGDKATDEKLVKILTEQGVLKPPSASAKADLTPFKSAINRMLKVDYAISEDVATELLSQIEAMEKQVPKEEPKAVKTPEKPSVQQPDKAKQYAMSYEDGQKAAYLEAAEFQAQYPTEFTKLHEKAFAKIAEIEAKLPPETRGNPALFASRYVKAMHAVLADRSKSSSVKPSPHQLRSTQPPAPVKKPEKGTEDYEIGLLTGKYTPDDE